MTPASLIESHLILNVTCLIEDMSERDSGYAETLSAVKTRLRYDEPAQQEGWSQVDDDEVDHSFVHEDGEISYANGWEALCREQHIEPYESSALEFYAVSDWLAYRLKSKGELVLEDFYGMCIWGRCTSGQAAKDDSVIEEIAASVE